MIKLQCDETAGDCIEAKRCVLVPGGVFIKIHERAWGAIPQAVSISPAKARALGLELIRLAGEVYTP